MEEDAPYARGPVWGSHPPGGHPVKGGGSGRLKTLVGAHPSAALAVIVILALLVVFLYALYRGLFGLGGGAQRQKADRLAAGRPARPKKPAAKSDGDSDDDPETERLIDSINRKGG